MSPRLLRFGPIVVAALLIPGRPLHGQLAADTVARVDRIFARYNRTDSPGCELGLDRDGQPLLRRGYGMASLELAVPWSESSVSESGSVAKQFTAGAITYLALKGKLDLDDPVRKYIPEVADYGSPVTIRMLLHHTSGVRDMWTLFTLAGMPIGSLLIRTDQALQMVYRQRELNFPPNSQYLYSNSGYLLLGEIVHRVTGRTLAEFSREVFFRPLGMMHTQWRDDWNRVIPGRVTAYDEDDDGYRVDMPYMDVYGAGGLLTTVGDLLRWNAELTNPTIGGRAWSDTLAHPGRLSSGRELDYGFGLSVPTYKGKREISHGGATGGYRTFLARWPDQRLSLALLCNLGTINPDRLAHQVADIFFGEGGTTATPATGGGGGGGSASPSAADLAVYAGRYRAPETEDLVALSVADGKLVLNGGRVALTPIGPDRFRIGTSTEIRFERGAGGRPARAIRISQDTVTYEAIGAFTTALPADLAGAYYAAELDATYGIVLHDGGIGATVGDEPEVRLDRTGPLSFGAPGRMSIRFTRGKGGKIDGFLLFAGRVRNLRFTRR